MDKRLGLAGYGSIARVVARRAPVVGFTIAAHDPFLAADAAAWGGTDGAELADLLATSDVVSLHVPLTAATRRMIDAAAIDRMRRTPCS